MGILGKGLPAEVYCQYVQDERIGREYGNLPGEKKAEMQNLTAIRIKANAHYTCQECPSTELIQAHHETPGDDSTQIPLCAECHSKKHPDVPKALFFSTNNQPYWHNKSASSLARELGAHPRTIIRAAKRLGVLPRELSQWDEELIRNNVKPTGRRIIHMNDNNKVRKLRQLLILDQQEFADVMAVDKGTVSRWERGKQRPRAVHLRRMARLQKKATRHEQPSPEPQGREFASKVVEG